mgnify:CR=1 FL=1
MANDYKEVNALSRAYEVGYDDGYQKAKSDTIEKFREYLKTVIPCEMPQDIWDMGVDNTCDRMLKEQKDG